MTLTTGFHSFAIPVRATALPLLTKRLLPLELLAGEELERGSVERFGVFVQAGVGEVLEDHELGALDAIGEGRGEAGRGDEVLAAEGDLGGGDDAAQLGRGVMGEDRFGLVQEGVDGLGWAAADEVLQGGDELRLLGGTSQA